jgi:hypothetical protein
MAYDLNCFSFALPRFINYHRPLFVYIFKSTCTLWDGRLRDYRRELLTPRTFHYYCISSFSAHLLLFSDGAFYLEARRGGVYLGDICGRVHAVVCNMFVTVPQTSTSLVLASYLLSRLFCVLHTNVGN